MTNSPYSSYERSAARISRRDPFSIVMVKSLLGEWQIFTKYMHCEPYYITTPQIDNTVSIVHHKTMHNGNQIAPTNHGVCSYSGSTSQCFLQKLQHSFWYTSIVGYFGKALLPGIPQHIKDKDTIIVRSASSVRAYLKSTASVYLLVCLSRELVQISI